MKRAATEKVKQPKLTNYFTTSSHTMDEESPKPSALIQNSVSSSSPCLVSMNQVNNVNGRKFQESWLKELKWLQYDRTTGIAKCVVCAAFPGISDNNSKVVSGFSGPFKLETFKKHDKALQHKKCIAAYNAEMCPEATPLARCAKKIDQKMFQHLKIVFNVAYYIAKNNKPFSDIAELLILADKLGVEVRKDYDNHKRCKEFVSHISSVLQKELLSELQSQNCFSLLLDGSTDTGGVEELILYARYIKEKRVKEIFLSILPLESVTSDGYLKATENELEKLGLSDCLSSGCLVGIGTDGAASMIGTENGLVTKLHKKINHLISIHCVAHKLNLSVLSAIKNVHLIDEIDSVLRKLYKFYQHSPNRMRQLQKVSELLQSQLLKFQYLHNVRWVASKVGALTALVKDWKCVTIHLENVANEKGNSSAVAKGLLRKLKDFKFLVMLHFLLDFLSVFKNLSLIFQKEELIISAVELHVKNAISTLVAMKDTPGHHEDNFVSNTTLRGIYQEVQLQGLDNNASSSFQTEKKKLLTCGIQYLEERFLQHNGSVQGCTSVFDTFTWPTGKDLEKFGKEELTILGQHFHKQLMSPGMSNEITILNLLSEWYEFKVIGQGQKFHELLEKVLTHKERFPLLSKLIAIVAVLPVSTVCCERGFSLMNLIKNKFRSQMEIQSLCDLMMINMNGPSLNEFDPSDSVDHWYFSAKTTRHIHGHKRATEK